MGRFIKDPQAELDYGWRWSGWLGTDTIAASTWSVIPSAAATIILSTHDDTTTTVRIAGGTHGQTVKLRNRITTTDGRTDDRTHTIEIRDR